MIKTDNTGFPIPYDSKFALEIHSIYDCLPKHLRVLLGGIGGCSPYLFNLLIDNKDWVIEKFSTDCTDVISEIKNDLDKTSDLQKTLRLSKSKIALWTAICDLGMIWDLEKVTATLTEFADLALKRAMEFEFNNNAKMRNLIGLEKKYDDSGWFVLAMGKMGAFELNYSSDIDLIFLFDESLYPDEKYTDVRMAFIRMSRSVNKLISETTGLGYVFRTDFRLRPNPSVTPICLSVDSALAYYESSGRSWERAAFIKARTCAGDLIAGQKFLKKLQPFIWRKHLDFATIKDAHDIRQQIKVSNLKSGSKKLFGQNIKLTEGGIRDIEFYAQTKQIIAGGRNQTLRSSQTCKALYNLEQNGWLKTKELNILINSYKFYRKIEHRLQMINDLQTHTIPKSEINFNRLSFFMGIKDSSDLHKKLNDNLLSVSKITGMFFSPEIERFEISEDFFNLSEEWLRLPALRSDKAKELFRNLRPIIIKKAFESGSPNITLQRFTRFLENLPSGVQLFSLFASNKELIDLLLEICASGEVLSNYLAKNSIVFDSVLDGNFFNEIEFEKIFNNFREEIFENNTDYEDQLNYTRRLYSELHFRIGVQFLRGIINSKEASIHYSKLADHILEIVWYFCYSNFETLHGKMPGKGAIVLGMGSLGARNMNAQSDLDLILIYDAQHSLRSDGKKPLDVQVYYSRLTKKFLTALNAKMSNGSLYQVDMRLRPSGNTGPIATSFASYQEYQLNKAWIWERLAFVRSRVICGSNELHCEFNMLQGNILSLDADREKLFKEILFMLAKINANKISEKFPWELKRGPGNMLTMELLGQGCALIFDIRSQDTCDHLNRLKDFGKWSASDQEKIKKLYQVLLSLKQVFAFIGDFRDVENKDAIISQRLILRETGLSSISELNNYLIELRNWVDKTIMLGLKQ